MDEFIAVTLVFFTRFAYLFYIYFAGVLVTRFLLRYLHDDREEYGQTAALWPIVLVVGAVYILFYEFPRRIIEGIKALIQNTRLDRASDFMIWWIFKRVVDRTDAGTLYRGPGPRRIEIHRLMVHDPTSGKRYWLTVPSGHKNADEALAWTWDVDINGFPAAQHV